MTHKNGHLNGSGHKPEEAGNVTSLDEARKRAAEKAKAERRTARSSRRGGPGTPRDWLIGGVFIVMAIGVIVWFVLKLMGKVG